MLLSTHSLGTYLETSSHATCQGTFGQSSQLTEPLWPNSGPKCGTSVHELSSTSKKKKKKREKKLVNERLKILPKSSQMRKKPPPPYELQFKATTSRF